MIKKIRNILLPILCLLLFLLFSFFGHYDSDDFSLIEQLNEIGIFKLIWNNYLNWDGRTFSFVALIQLSLLKYCNPKFIVFIWNIVFLCTVFLMYILISRVSKFKLNKDLNSFVLLLFVLWLGNYTNIADTLYWCTGGVYTLSLFLLLLWIYVFETSHYKGINISLVQLLPFSLLTALSSPQVALIMLAYLLIENFRTVKNKKLVPILIVVLLGLGISVLAPGNYRRATFSPRGFDFELIDILNNSVLLYSKFILFGSFLFLLALVWGYFVKGFRFNNLWLKAKSFQWKWFALAFVSALPLVVLPDFVGHRPSIFFLWFMVLFILTSFNHDNANSNNAFKKNSVTVLNILFLLVLLFQLGFNFKFHKSLKERDCFLFENNKSTDTIEITYVKQKIIPFTYKHQDVLNKPYASFFNYKHIRYKEENIEKPRYFRTYLNEEILVK